MDRAVRLLVLGLLVACLGACDGKVGLVHRGPIQATIKTSPELPPNGQRGLHGPVVRATRGRNIVFSLDGASNIDRVVWTFPDGTTSRAPEVNWMAQQPSGDVHAVVENGDGKADLFLTVEVI